MGPRPNSHRKCSSNHLAAAHRYPKPIPGSKYWYKAISCTLHKLVEQHHNLLLSTIFGCSNMDFTEEERADWYSCYGYSEAILEETKDLMDKVAELRTKYLPKNECKPIEESLKRGIEMSDVDTRLMIQQLRSWGFVTNDVLRGLIFNELGPGYVEYVTDNASDDDDRQIDPPSKNDVNSKYESRHSQAEELEHKPLNLDKHQGPEKLYSGKGQRGKDEQIENQQEEQSNKEECKQQQQNASGQVHEHQNVLAEADRLLKSVQSGLRDEQSLEGLQAQTQRKNHELSNLEIHNQTPIRNQKQLGKLSVESKEQLRQTESITELPDHPHQMQIETEKLSDYKHEYAQKTPSEHIVHQQASARNPLDEKEISQEQDREEDRELEGEGQIFHQVIKQIKSRKQDLQQQFEEKNLDATEQQMYNKEQEDNQVDKGNVHYIKIQCKLHQDELQKQIDQDNRDLHNQEVQLLEDSLHLYTDQLQLQEYNKHQNNEKSLTAQENREQDMVLKQKELIVKQQQLHPRSHQPKKKRLAQEFVPVFPPPLEATMEQDKPNLLDQNAEENGISLDPKYPELTIPAQGKALQMKQEPSEGDWQQETWKSSNNTKPDPGELLLPSATLSSTLFPVRGLAIKAEAKPNKISPKKLPINPMMKSTHNSSPDVAQNKCNSSTPKVKLRENIASLEALQSQIENEDKGLAVSSPTHTPSDLNLLRSPSRPFSPYTVLPEIIKGSDG